MLTDYFDAYATRYRAYKGGAWCYEDGCIYQGLRELAAATGDARWHDHLVRLVTGQVDPDGRIAGYDPAECNIDNLLPGRALVHLDAATGDPRYRAAARHLRAQLDIHPRTPSGNFWHKKIYPGQVWLDGLYMGLPFMIEHGLATGETGLVDDALGQLATALELTRRPDGLYAHGCDVSRAQRWADPATGHSPAAWARALGWLAMALVDIADDIGPARAARSGVAGATAALLDAVAARTTPGGLWLQVIDLPALAGNYEESSASAMFAYAFQKAARIGIAADAAAGRGALDRLEAGRVRPDAAGTVHFEGICHVAGLGGFGAVYRDGTPAYYLTEPVVADDPKGVGPLMMAAAEAIRATAPSAVLAGA